MNSPILSRLTIRRDVALSSLLSVLISSDGTVAPLTGKALMWAVFDREEGHRDFLWRESGDGVFYTRSVTPPIDAQGLFTIDAANPVTGIAAGSRLAFNLRANPVVRLKRPGKLSAKNDVLMHALYGVPKGARAGVRDEVGRKAALSWLARQAGRSGFSFVDQEVVLTSVREHSFKKPGQTGDEAVRFTSVDFEGLLTVTDPDAFNLMLSQGLGSAKAYGNGLMLVSKGS